jgi:hypothetical protein
MEEIGSHQKSMCPDAEMDELWLSQAPEGGEDAQGQRIDPPGHEGPGSEVVGAAAGPGEGLERWEMAVGAAEAPRPRINSLSPPRPLVAVIMHRVSGLTLQGMRDRVLRSLGLLTGRGRRQRAGRWPWVQLRPHGPELIH